jgi:hypothetical protein
MLNSGLTNNFMIMKRIALSFLLLAAGFNFLLAQTNIFVSPTGSSGNAGTEASPKDLNSVINSSTLGANNTVILLDGTYNLTDDLYLWKKQGTASQPLIIKAKNKHQAILKGNSAYSSNRYGVFYLAGCKHVIVDGLTVMHDVGSNDQQYGIQVSTAVGTPAEYSEYVTIKNCKVYGHGGGGISSSAADHITFENNIVYDNCTRNPINTSGISIYKPKAGTSDGDYWGLVIRGNTCYNNKCELNFYYNENGTIYQNDSPTDGNGIILDLFDNDGGNPAYGKRVLVENNLCYNNGGAGIKSYKSSLARIINNTCYHNNSVLNLHGVSAQIFMFETGGYNGVYNEGIYNNVAVTNPNLTTNTDYAMCIDFDLGKVYNNFLIGKGAKFVNYSYDESNFATANTFKDKSDQDAAKFQNAGGGNFNLKPESPLIGGYLETYHPTVDIIGTARPQGTYADQGAYEFLYVTSVSLNTSTATVAAGSTVTLTATVAPSNASFKNVTWSSATTSVATVNASGVVTGVAAGTSIITVTTLDGAKIARCTVTVTGTSSIITNNAIYRLKSVSANRYLNSQGNTNGANVGIADLNTSWDSEKWRLEQVSGTTYRLRSNYGQKYLNGGNTNGANVNVANLNTAWDSEKWTLELVTGNTYRLKCNWGSKYLNAQANTNGANVGVANLNNTATSQQWILEYVSASVSAPVISAVAQAELTAYPNPFYNSINVSIIDQESKDIDVKVISLSGQEVYHLKHEIHPGQKQFSLDLSAIQSGFYILVVNQGSKKETTKIFKQ